jgi:hypothetical protein
MNIIWTATEIAYLRAERAKAKPTPIPRIAAALGRPVAATYNRARLVGAVVQPHRPYTEADREAVRALVTGANPPTDGEIAQAIGRTIQSTRHLIAELGLTGVRPSVRAEARALAKANAPVRVPRPRATRDPAERERRAHERAERRAAREAQRALDRSTTKEARAAARATARATARADASLAAEAAREARRAERAAAKTATDAMLRADRERAAAARAEADRLKREAAAEARAAAALVRKAAAAERKAERQRLAAEQREQRRRERLVAQAREKAERLAAIMATKTVRPALAAPPPVVIVRKLDAPVAGATVATQHAPAASFNAARRNAGRMAPHSQSLALAAAARDAIAAHIAAHGVTRIVATPLDNAIAALRRRGYEVLTTADGHLIDQRVLLKDESALIAFANDRRAA